MEDILLIGGGGHCKSVIDVIENGTYYRVAGIVDKKKNVGKKVLGYEIIGSDEDLPKLRKQFKNAIATIGQITSSSFRVSIFENLIKLEFNIPVIISPLAYISKHAKVDNGTVVLHGVIINAKAKVGRNCIINTKALIEHDAVVEDHCHISTGAIVNGGVRVKENTFFGSNSTSKEYVEVSGFIKSGSIAK